MDELPKQPEPRAPGQPNPAWPVEPVTFESEEPERRDMPERRSGCDQSWRPADPGFRVRPRED